MIISIIIRTLNEERYLGALLDAISRQKFLGNLQGSSTEVILVDSGSTDQTIKIAKSHSCVITTIDRSVFSFGRSLNLGCKLAKGDILVFISGHCVPVDELWLSALCNPVAQSVVDYAYGRQIGGKRTRISEQQIFSKYFSASSSIPQQGFFCNNANSALSKKVFELYEFNEEITGLEDMELAKRLVGNSGKVGYVAEAVVYHHHYESWSQVRRRFEREAIALRGIMPQVHVHLSDILRYMLASIIRDLVAAKNQGVFLSSFFGIFFYRFNQYIGVYVGNHQHRRLSRSEKDRYFYPS